MTSTKYHVLLVEDNDADAFLVKAALRDTGGVETALRHAESLEEASEGLLHRPDAILLDLCLPGTRGLETLEAMVRMAAQTPIIVMTGMSDHELGVRAVQQGAQDYLIKGEVKGPLLIRSIRYAVERHRANQALQASHDRFRALFDSSLDALLLADDNARYVDANPAAESLLGLSLEEVRRLHVWDFTPIPNQEMGLQLWRSFLAEGKQAGEYELRRKDGSIVHVDYRAVAHIGQGLHLSAIRDVTERKRAEAALRQSEKMAAVGQLAGGVAHDFNNLLTAVMANAQYVRKSLDADSPLQEEIDEILCSVERGAALTGQLLAFSGQKVVQPALLGLNQVISGMERMGRRLLGEGITWETRLEPGLGTVMADQGQIEQVLLNLILNARDAMPSGGGICIETGNTRNDGTGHDIPLGDYVSVSVRDTGTGIAKDVISHVFEPFFTTKGELGTGIGLATVHGIVQDAKGHIRVDSEPGEGTTFTIYFPRSPEAVPAVN
jgi:two-component system, cell cycle sensor histidine kinase and response regulator CckA